MKKNLLLILFIFGFLTNTFAQWSTSQTWNNEDKSKLFGRLIQGMYEEKIPEYHFSIMNSNDFTLNMLLMVEYMDEKGNIINEIVYQFYLPGRRYSFEDNLEDAFKKAGEYTSSLTEFLDKHVVYVNKSEWKWFPKKENKYFGYPFQNLFYLMTLENEDEAKTQKFGWWRIGGVSRRGKFELSPKCSFLSFYIQKEIP